MTRRHDPAYCFGVAGVAKAPWRPSLDQAKADAVDLGFASMSEYDETIFITVPGEIWVTHELVCALPRDPIVAPARDRDPLARVSRIDRIIARREAKQGHKEAPHI